MDSAPRGSGRIGRRYVVSGRVQGVGFRYFVLRHAQGLGLAGWVRNLPGGEVEVAAWGGEPAQASLSQELAVGPRSARVTKVESFEISDGVDIARGFHVID